MTLPPPSFRIILALVGAALILWGAKGEVVNVSGVGTLSFFEMGIAVAWTLVVAAVAVVPLSVMRTPALAWVSWVAAISAVAWFTNDILARVDLLRASDDVLAPMVTRVLHTSEFKPGAVSIVVGLVIQAVGLCLRRRA